jgi:hypothetical protein
VAIRRGGDAFASWRSELRDVLGRIARDYDERGDLPTNEVLAEVRERLAASRARAEQEVRQSGFLGRAQAGAKNVALGAAAAGITSQFLGPEALIGSAAAVPVQLLWAWVTSRASETGQAGALLRHYAVFSPEHRR